jgi:hypothetical protein
MSLRRVGNVLAYNDTSVTIGQTYYYQVIAINMAQIAGTVSNEANGMADIPEFPSFLLLSLFMIVTLLAAMVVRRRHRTHRYNGEPSKPIMHA